MKIGIIGTNGFLGCRLYSDMVNSYGSVIGITRENYKECLGTYDIIINANGNSRKYWANNNILEDFSASVVSVYNSIFDFSCGLYVYISTADIYSQPTHYKPTEDIYIKHKQQSVYGFHKLLSELVVKKYQTNSIILRCSAIVGENLKKGVIYDAIKGFDVFVTEDSCLQFISSKEIVNIIKQLLDNNIKNITINVGGCGVVSVKQIADMVNSKLIFSPQAAYQYYEMNVDKLKKMFPLKTSKYYVEEITNEGME